MSAKEQGSCKSVGGGACGTNRSGMARLGRPLPVDKKANEGVELCSARIAWSVGKKAHGVWLCVLQGQPQLCV